MPAARPLIFLFCRSSPVGRMAAGSLLAVALASTLSAQTPARPSPFVRPTAPPASSAAPVPSQTEYELHGIMKLGASTLVCITVVADKRSHWIKVGETAGGIQVVDHDASTGRVTMQRSGRQIVLQLKEPTYDPARLAAYQAPVAMPEPLPSAGVALNVAVTNEDKATEARMLVSDLLEIGLIQRKAYEEAQAKQEAEGRPPQSAPPPGASSP